MMPGFHVFPPSIEYSMPSAWALALADMRMMLLKVITGLVTVDRLNGVEVQNWACTPLRPSDVAHRTLPEKKSATGWPFIVWLVSYCDVPPSMPAIVVLLIIIQFL